MTILSSEPDDSSLVSVEPTPDDLVSNVAQVVTPPAAPATPATPATPAAPKTPEQLVASISQVIPPPKVSTSTTTVQGRSKAGVENQIATDQAALNQYQTTVGDTAKQADARQQSALDSQIDTKQNQRVDLLLEQQRQQDIQKQTDEEVTRLQDLPDGKLDPDRFVNSLTTGGKIGMAVLAMVSGLASAFQGQPGANPFMAQIDRRISQDIDAQKDELAQGRVRKNNLIARALAKGADAKQAEATARGQLWQLAGQIGDAQAQRLGLQGAQADAAKNAIAGMYYQSAQHSADLRAQTEAKVQTTRTATSTQPVAYAQRLELGATLKAKGATPEQIAAAGGVLPEGQTADERKAASEAGKRSEGEGKVAGALAGTQQLATAAHLARDPQTGKLVPPPGKGGESLPPESSWTWDPRFWRWGQGAPVRNARARASAVLAATGGIKESDADELLTAGTYQELADKLNGIEETLSPRLNQQDRAAPVDASSLGFRAVK